MFIEVIMYIGIGLTAGVMSGMFGIGGGVIIVPALILIAGFSQPLANGTSLAALLLPVGIFAVLTYYRAKFIHVRSAVGIAIGLFTGVSIGALIALSIPSGTLKQWYGIFLLYISYRFIDPKSIGNLYKQIIRQGESNTTENIKVDPSTIETIDNQRGGWLSRIFLGICAGILSGLFGIGGGIVIVPFLTTFMKYDQKTAVGTSLAGLLLPVGLPGVIIYYKAGQFDLFSAVLVALGLLIGAVVGANISIKLPSKIINRLYGLFLLVVAISFII